MQFSIFLEKQSVTSRIGLLQHSDTIRRLSTFSCSNGIDVNTTRSAVPILSSSNERETSVIGEKEVQQYREYLIELK